MLWHIWCISDGSGRASPAQKVTGRSHWFGRSARAEPLAILRMRGPVDMALMEPWSGRIGQGFCAVSRLTISHTTEGAALSKGGRGWRADVQRPTIPRWAAATIAVIAKGEKSMSTATDRSIPEPSGAF